MLDLVPEPYKGYLVALGGLFVFLEVVVYPLLGDKATTKWELLKKIPVAGSVIEVLEAASKLGRKA